VVGRVVSEFVGFFTGVNCVGELDWIIVGYGYVWEGFIDDVEIKAYESRAILTMIQIRIITIVILGVSLNIFSIVSFVSNLEIFGIMSVFMRCPQ